MAGPMPTYAASNVPDTNACTIAGPEEKRVSCRSSPAYAAQPSPWMTNNCAIGRMGM